MAIIAYLKPLWMHNLLNRSHVRVPRLCQYKGTTAGGHGSDDDTKADESVAPGRCECILQEVGEEFGVK